MHTQKVSLASAFAVYSKLHAQLPSSSFHFIPQCVSLFVFALFLLITRCSRTLLPLCRSSQQQQDDLPWQVSVPIRRVLEQATVLVEATFRQRLQCMASVAAANVLWGGRQREVKRVDDSWWLNCNWSLYLYLEPQTAGQSMLIVSSSSYWLMLKKCHFPEQWQFTVKGTLIVFSRKTVRVECSLSSFAFSLVSTSLSLSLQSDHLHVSPIKVSHHRYYYWKERLTADSMNHRFLLAFSLSLSPIMLVSCWKVAAAAANQSSVLIGALEGGKQCFLFLRMSFRKFRIREKVQWGTEETGTATLYSHTTG